MNTTNLQNTSTNNLQALRNQLSLANQRIELLSALKLLKETQGCLPTVIEATQQDLLERTTIANDLSAKIERQKTVSRSKPMAKSASRGMVEI